MEYAHICKIAFSILLKFCPTTSIVLKNNLKVLHSEGSKHVCNFRRAMPNITYSQLV